MAAKWVYTFEGEHLLLFTEPWHRCLTCSLHVTAALIIVTSLWKRQGFWAHMGSCPTWFGQWGPFLPERFGTRIYLIYANGVECVCRQGQSMWWTWKGSKGDMKWCSWFSEIPTPLLRALWGIMFQAFTCWLLFIGRCSLTSFIPPTFIEVVYKVLATVL